MHVVLKHNETLTVRSAGNHHYMLELYPALDRNSTGLQQRLLPCPGGPVDYAAPEPPDRRYVCINLSSYKSIAALADAGLTAIHAVYRNPDGAVIGDDVVVVLSNGEPRVRSVIGYGRGDGGVVHKAARLVSAVSD